MLPIFWSQLPVSHTFDAIGKTSNIDSIQASCPLGLWCSEQPLPACVVSAIRRQFTEEGGLHKCFEWPHFGDNKKINHNHKLSYCIKNCL